MSACGKRDRGGRDCAGRGSDGRLAWALPACADVAVMNMPRVMVSPRCTVPAVVNAVCESRSL